MERRIEEDVAWQPNAGPTESRRREFWGGVMAITPLLLGAAPFGLIYGVLAVNAGLSTVLAQGMSPIIFAGSAQFITAQLLQDGAPLLVIGITAAVLNLRHVLYSASLAPHLQHLNRGWKALLAYLLTDEAYAVAITRYWDNNSIHAENKVRNDTQEKQQQRGHQHWYVLGTGASLWLTWQISTAVGIFLGAQIPEAWSLDFALPLTFIAIVVPALRDRAMVGAAVAAALAVLLTLAMPLKLGLVTAILVGIGVGWLLQSVMER